MPVLLIFLFSFLAFRPAAAAHCSTSSTTTFQKCMTLPSQQASIAWTFQPHNATLEVAFFGTFISPSGWVGWGINPTSPEMTGTRALIAFPDPNSGQLVLLPYIIDPTVKLQRSPLLSRPLDIHLLSSSATLHGGDAIRDGASVQIRAMLKLVPNKTKVHYVWNRGLYVQGYSPTIHPTTVADLSSTATVDVLSGAGSVTRGGDLQTLKVVHAIINGVAWGVFLPAGAATARYLRQAPAALGPAWFYAHAGVQLAALFLGTVGFGFGVRLGQLSPGRVYGLHRKLGFAAVCLGGLQTVALLFRPKTTNRYRKYWKSYHHFVGYACVVIGVVNVFEGFEVMGENRSYAKLAFCLSLATLIGACVALEVNAWVIFCRKATEEKLRREGFAGGSEKACGLTRR